MLRLAACQHQQHQQHQQQHHHQLVITQGAAPPLLQGAAQPCAQAAAQQMGLQQARELALDQMAQWQQASRALQQGRNPFTPGAFADASLSGA
jgi:hypothetical protein